MNNQIVVDVYGDYACFTNPQFKLDRLTYDVITPSAARGILNAIYSKPAEFYYQIVKIEVMKEIQYIDIKKNELKDGRMKPSLMAMDRSAEGEYTQRSNRYLRDVYYRIYAKIIPQESFMGTVAALVDQFNRRVSHGKCFYQPCLGTRECTAYFSPPDMNMKPIHITRNFGMSLYDVFNLKNNQPLSKKNANSVLDITYYQVNMENGTIDVPEYTGGPNAG